jgi:putative PIG3 family NAD(P)H quinone oxidoreductase
VRAIVIARPGGPEVLEIRDVATPAPGEGDVRVRVRAFGINRADLLQRRGLYPAPPDAPADIPGLEYAGEVHALGATVRGLAVGDRVMGIVGGGSYAEYVLTPATHVVPMPAAMSFEDAGAIPEAFLTAHDALEQIAVVSGEWVLIHAVGSGVGTAAVQLVRARGARSVGTSRTRAKLEHAAELGMDAGIDTTAEELVAAVKRITGAGAHAVVDLIGGADFTASLKALAPRGRLIVVGLTAGSRAEVDLSLVLRQRLRIQGTVLRSRSKEEKTEITASFARDVLPLFAAKRAVPVVDRVFAFEEIREAHAYVETNANFGKVVVQGP